MSVSILKLTGGAPIAADSSWDGKEIWVDSQTGPTLIELPAASSLPAGWKVALLRKSDPFSNTIQVKPTASGDRLNHFWTSSTAYGLFLNLSQQACEISCDGVSEFFMAGKVLHRGAPQSQRTVTIPTWNLTPESVNEIVRCNCVSAGGAIGIYVDPISNFLPVSPLTGGNYLSVRAKVMKVDADTSKPVVIIPSGGAQCFPSNDPQGRGYYYLTKQWSCASLYISSDGIFLEGPVNPD